MNGMTMRGSRIGNLLRLGSGPATLFLVCAIALCIAAPSAADEAPAPPWSGSLGLAFLATSGNTDTQTFGLELAAKKAPDPWGLELSASYLKSEDSGDTTAERYGAKLRAERKPNDRWSLFGGLSGERDTFAGYDLRGILETGAVYTALAGPVHTLSFDGGVTWTKESFVDGTDNDFAGGLLGLTYSWKPRKGTEISERLVWYPNLDQTSDWRATSETAVQAALSDRLALKVGYEIRYDNEPVPGFDDTDTTTRVSLVVSF